tara:strand:- start:123 stop:572 length:450 start_codon:yes stop_codon:yes gene_type:complete
MLNEKLLIFVPQILSILTMIIFPNNFDDNKKVFFQPPGYVFGIVWTFLYFLIGLYIYKLVKERSTNRYFKFMLIIFMINLLLNLSWTPVVNYYKRYTLGIFMIAIMIMTTFLLITIDKNELSRVLLIPYLSWLFVALLLNIELSRIYKK